MTQKLTDIILGLQNSKTSDSEKYIKIPKDSVLNFTTSVDSSRVASTTLTWVQDTTTWSTPTWETDYGTGTYTIVGPGLRYPPETMESVLTSNEIFEVSSLTTKNGKISFLRKKVLPVSIFIKKGKILIQKRPAERFQRGDELFYLNKDEIFLTSENEKAFLLLGTEVKKDDLSLVIKLLLNLDIVIVNVTIPEKIDKAYKDFAIDFETKISKALIVEKKEENE